MNESCCTERRTNVDECALEFDVVDVDGDECRVGVAAVAGLDGEHVLLGGLVVEVGVVDHRDLAAGRVEAHRRGRVGRVDE